LTEATRIQNMKHNKIVKSEILFQQMQMYVFLRGLSSVSPVRTV